MELIIVRVSTPDFSGHQFGYCVRAGGFDDESSHPRIRKANEVISNPTSASPPSWQKSRKDSAPSIDLQTSHSTRFCNGLCNGFTSCRTYTGLGDCFKFMMNLSPGMCHPSCPSQARTRLYLCPKLPRPSRRKCGSKNPFCRISTSRFRPERPARRPRNKSGNSRGSSHSSRYGEAHTLSTTTMLIKYTFDM